jgi:hypothetical protein
MINLIVEICSDKIIYRGKYLGQEFVSVVINDMNSYTDGVYLLEVKRPYVDDLKLHVELVDYKRF